jgi:hypothetical protein
LAQLTICAPDSHLNNSSALPSSVSIVKETSLSSASDYRGIAAVIALVVSACACGSEFVSILGVISSLAKACFSWLAGDLLSEWNRWNNDLASVEREALSSSASDSGVSSGAVGASVVFAKAWLNHTGLGALAFLSKNASG